jgi:Uma2 family endonuclease
MVQAQPTSEHRLPAVELPPLVLHLRPAIEMTAEQFSEFCQLNRDLRIERTAGGDLIVMPPTFGKTGARNAEITAQLQLWAKRDRSGVAFDSSTGFTLPNGATRSPDAAWVKRTHLARLTPEQKEKFLPLCPDFVIELRSPSDPLKLVQGKMREYIANGARLGWLVDPLERRVYVYRPRTAVKRLDRPAHLSADPVLLGFVLDLSSIWEPNL